MEPKKTAIEINLPKKFKEDICWVKAKPCLHRDKKDKWWQLYEDTTLNQLEKKINCQNNQLKVIYQQYREAKQVARIARSYLYPTITGIYNMSRVENSSHVANYSLANRLIYGNFLLSGLVNYEVDLWGKIRSTVRSNDLSAVASKLDVAALSLSLHAQLASDYFLLRSTDKIQYILDKNVAINEKVLKIRQHQHQGGLVDQSQVLQASQSFEQARLLQHNNQIKRAQLEHAIALLVGETPSLFNICPAKVPYRRVSIKPEMPSLLLERRPDVVAAQYRVMSAQSNIGYARAAFFPAINLFGILGVQSSELGNLFARNSLYWSLGPTAGTTVVSLVKPMVTQTVFDGFKLPAQLSKAWVLFKEASSFYREVVLKAIKEVEDQLIAIQKLDEQLIIANQEYQSVCAEYQQALNRHQAGINTYLQVAPTELKKLQIQIKIIQLQTRRQIASVELIKALGGSWSSGSRHLSKMI